MNETTPSPETDETLAPEGDTLDADIVTGENVNANAPALLSGDLHLVPEGLFFLCYQKQGVWQTSLAINLGLLGAWLAHRAAKRRQREMVPWREAQAGQPLDALVQQNEHSFWITPGEMQSVKMGIMGLTVKRNEGKACVLAVPKDRRDEVKAFATQQGWPLA